MQDFEIVFLTLVGLLLCIPILVVCIKCKKDNPQTAKLPFFQRIDALLAQMNVVPPAMKDYPVLNLRLPRPLIWLWPLVIFCICYVAAGGYLPDTMDDLTGNQYFNAARFVFFISFILSFFVAFVVQIFWNSILLITKRKKRVEFSFLRDFYIAWTIMALLYIKL